METPLSETRHERKKAEIVALWEEITPSAVQQAGRLEIMKGKGGLTKVRFKGILPATAGRGTGPLEDPATTS